MNLTDEIVIISVGGGILTALCSMCLNFIIKSRCKKIKTCCCEVDRDVIQTNLSDNIISIPNNLANNNNNNN